MSKCQDIQGSMAAALYEPLDPAEQSDLDAHLETCVACRAEFAGLQTMVQALPAEAIEFQGDLRPVLREEVRRVSVRKTTRNWWLAGSMAASAIVCFGLLFQVLQRSLPVEDSVAAQPSPTDRILADAHERLAADDVSGAIALLIDARDAAESKDIAGRFQLEIAHIEFDVFRRYEEAFDNYRLLREEYGEVWARSDARVKERFDLLTEARENSFEALYQMDNARNQGEAGLPILEELMARYPGRTIAREALGTMVALVDREGVGALEEVKDRCTNPVTVAQLDVHLGERYWTEQRNPDRGRQLLQGVANGEHEIPAQMAKDVMARLERTAD